MTLPRRLLFFSLIFFSPLSVAFENCQYGKSSCPENQYCIQVDKDKSECRPYPAPLPTLTLSYPTGVEITCDQGSLSPAGNSHTWLNTAFALDLKSPRKILNSKVFAVIDGVVAAHSECRSENDQCGMGFGNQVKIFAKDGYVVLYAHLKETPLKTGDRVKKGDLIGIEGTSGWTGPGNRHLHFSLHFDWRPEGFDYWKAVGYLPASVPYSLSICENCFQEKCRLQSVDVRSLACRRTHKKVPALCSP